MLVKHEQFLYRVRWSSNGPKGMRLQAEPRKMHNPVLGPALLWTLAIIALVVLALVLALNSGLLTIFEDGSWTIGLRFPWIASGCLPGGLCNL